MEAAAVIKPQSNVKGPVKLVLGIFLLGPMYVMTTLTLLMLIVFYLLIVPKFKEIYKDFGVQLSAVQSLMNSISDLLLSTFVLPVWVWAACGVIVVMTTIAVLFFQPRTKGFAGILILVMFLLTALAVCTTIFNCIEPLNKMIEQMSENAAKGV